MQNKLNLEFCAAVDQAIFIDKYKGRREGEREIVYEERIKYFTKGSKP